MQERVRITAVGLLLPLVACGATPAPAVPAEQASSTATVAASPSSTPAPKDGIPPSFSPCAPIATPKLGLDNSPVQVGPDSWDVFVTSNQWLGPVNGSTVRWYSVWAGTTGDAATAPGVAAVWVNITSLGSDLCSTNMHSVGQFTDRGARGSFRITAVSGSSVYLKNGVDKAVFNLTTDTFAD
jgi:hypothetical protein